jgi:RNA polymerase primary sigma factor
MPGSSSETINRLARVSPRMLLETGRQPTAEELARRLAMPFDRVKQLVAIAGVPVKYETLHFE